MTNDPQPDNELQTDSTSVIRTAATRGITRNMAAFADLLPLIVWTARADGRLDFYNKQWFEYTGLDLAQTEERGWESVLHPDDVVHGDIAWQTAVKTGEPYEIEYRLRRASDKSYRWHLGRAQPMRDAAGMVVRWFGTSTDVDDYKRLREGEKNAREALVRSGLRFGSLVKASTNIVWTTDDRGLMSIPQPSWAAFTGQRDSEYTGSGWLDAIHPDDLEKARAAWFAAIEEKQPVTLEHRLRRHDGAWHDMTMRAVPVVEADGTVQEWVGAHFDVTERKQVEREGERARQEAEDALAQLEAVLTSAQDGIILSDPDGNVRLWNPAALAMHEYQTLDEAQQHIDVFVDTFEMLNPTGQLVALKDWPIVRLMRDETFSDYEMQVRRRDTGNHWWASYNGNVVRDKDGKPLLLLLTVRDISERRRMQAQRDTLLRRVEDAAQQQRRFLREMLSSMTEGRLRLCDKEADLPHLLGTDLCAPPVELSRTTIRTLRQQLDRCCQEAGLPLDRQNDLVTAVGEAAMNAVVHAGGGTGRIYSDNRRGMVQVWVQDRGHGIKEESLHRATLEKGFSSAGTLGHGFWMMLKTADRVYLLTGANGTTIVLEQEKEPPLPAWLQTNSY